MSLKEWEEKVLKARGALARVAEIEDELRLAAGLTSLREQAGYSQREVARRMGISQPRVAAIEQSRNVTIDVLEQYVEAVGGKLEVAVVKGKRRIPLLTSQEPNAMASPRMVARKASATRRKSARATTRGRVSRSA